MLPVGPAHHGPRGTSLYPQVWIGKREELFNWLTQNHLSAGLWHECGWAFFNVPAQKRTISITQSCSLANLASPSPHLPDFPSRPQREPKATCTLCGPQLQAVWLLTLWPFIHINRIIGPRQVIQANRPLNNLNINIDVQDYKWCKKITCNIHVDEMYVVLYGAL